MKSQWIKEAGPLLKNLSHTAAAKISSVWHAILGTANSSRRSHHILASLMVIVATLGAIFSGLTAIAENEAERLARQLTQGHHLGLTYRQELLTDVAMRSVLEERKKACATLGQQYLSDANQKGSNRREAAVLDMLAQEQFAAARALQWFLYVLPNPFYSELSVEQSLQKRAAFYLQARGFKAHWQASKEITDSSNLIWEPLNAELRAAHDSVNGLARGVVLFVAALVLFTISDLQRRRVWRWRFLYLGVVVACGALGYVAYVIQAHGSPIFTQSRPVLAAQLLLTGLLIFAFLDLFHAIRSPQKEEEWEEAEEGGNLEPELHEPTGFAGEPLHIREAGKGFSRCIVLLIVITVFFTALCSYWYSRAAGQAAKAAHEAVEDLLEMNCRSSRLNTSVNSVLLSLAENREYHARYAVLRQLEMQVQAAPESYPAATGIRAEVYRHLIKLDEQKWADELKNLVAGIETNPNFPLVIKYWPLHNREKNWHEYYALWYAHSQRSLAWHRQARVFLSILTVLAMAIYLFGQGHGMGEGPASRRLMVYGLILLVISLGLTLESRWAEGPGDKTSEEKEAAVHYAAAMATYSTAHNPEDYGKVVKELDQTVKCRPDFVLAHRDLADALALGRSSQMEENIVHLPTKAQLPSIVEHEKIAIDAFKLNGYAEPAGMLNDLGYFSLLLALEKAVGKKSPQEVQAEVQKSIRTLQAARDSCGGCRPKTKALIHANLALAWLAAKERQQADTAYTTALKVDGLSPADLEALIISGFTALEVLTKYYGSLHPGEDLKDLIQNYKERLAAAWPGPSSPDKESKGNIPTNASGTLEVSAHTVRWRGQLPKFDGSRDRLCIIWYARDKDWDVWRALPVVSGLVDHTKVKRVQGNSLEIERSFLAETSYTRCLPDGSYKAESYLNGRAAAVSPVTKTQRWNYRPVFLPALNVGLCRPEDWRPLNLPEEIQDNNLLLRGFQTKEGKLAALVFTFYVPRFISEPEFINYVEELLKTSGLMQGKEFKPYEPQRAAELAQAAGAVLYKYWITAEGVRHVGVVFPGAAPGDELLQTLDSMANKY
ncbi:MAG: hypothetical protein ACYDIC_17025 [Desulfobaccales bacterium]